MAKKEETLGVVLLSKLGSMILIVSMFITMYVVIMTMLYMKYHNSECAQHEPSSRFLIGDAVLLRTCPISNELLEKALVESYSDGGEFVNPDA